MCMHGEVSLKIEKARQTFNDFVADLSVRSGLDDGRVRGSAIGRYCAAQKRGHSLRSRAKSALSHYVRSSGPRARSDFELVACALDFTLVNGIGVELDHRP